MGAGGEGMRDIEEEGKGERRSVPEE